MCILPASYACGKLVYLCILATLCICICLLINSRKYTYVYVYRRYIYVYRLLVVASIHMYVFIADSIHMYTCDCIDMYIHKPAAV